MKTVAFVFDYVMHYHREMLRAVEAQLRSCGISFVLLTAAHRKLASGRTPVEEAVVESQRTYELLEKPIGGFMLRHQSGLIKELKALKPDVVVTMCHSGTISEWLAIRLKRELRFRLVAWQCGYEYNPGKLKNAVLSAFIPHFDRHLAYHSNARDFALRYGATQAQITVMHNTINEEKIECLPKPEARQWLADKHPELAGRTIVLYVGAVLEEKRLDTVLQALNQLRDPRLAFLVVGDGPHLAHLISLSAGRPDVFFAGRVVEGVGHYFDAADMLVLPGTGGLALNEAMAHSLPLISGYADGSADDLVLTGVNGFRLERGTADEIAIRIAELAADPALRERMGCASREMITTRFSFKNFIERVVTVLEAA